MQAWSGGSVAYAVVLEVVEPLLNRSASHAVKLVNADYEVFGENVAGHAQFQLIHLLGAHLQAVAGVHTQKLGLAVVEVVAAAAEVEIEDIYGIHFLHVSVILAQRDVFCDSLRHAVEHALQVVNLPRELHLNDYNLTLGVESLDIYAIKLVVVVFLVALALKNLTDSDFLAEKHSDKPFKHIKVGFVAQYSLYRPVESYIFVVHLHNYLPKFISLANLLIFNYNGKSCHKVFAFLRNTSQ